MGVGDGLGVWDGNAIKLGCDDHCTAINVIKFIELKKKNVYLVRSNHLDRNKDPIWNNLIVDLGSNQVAPSDWRLVAGKGDDMIRKLYKSLRQQRKEADTSSSGVTVWVLHLA